MSVPTSPAAGFTGPPCDCCGATTWRYLFSDAGRDLGRCETCGLHSVAQIPSIERRMTEFEQGHFGSGDVIATAGKDWLRGEHVREREFTHYVELVQALAPAGRWLDIGCGAGTLIRAAQRLGQTADGIELTADRRAHAIQSTGATIYDRPIEDLSLADGSYAAVFLIDVFSHLISPSHTLADIHRVLVPGGVVLLHTSEIGPGVRKEHHRTWLLGDHLYFLGEHTIERYCATLDFELASRERIWQPEKVYTREHLRLRGPSRAKNLAKQAVLAVPGAFPALRWYALKRQHVGNPVYASTLVLRKPG